MSELNGKKIIFIGDSFIYYGQVVFRTTWDVLTQEERTGDKGYFYQLCRALGDEVSVTNWTFGSHGLTTHLSESCPSKFECHGVNHLNYLKDRKFDFVVMSGGRKTDEEINNFLPNVKRFMDIFRVENPDAKFFYLVSSGAHNISVRATFPVHILNNLKTISEWGVTVIDWGSLVADIIRANVLVPGGVCSYGKKTFTVSRSEKDGFHPNQLAGYITALMTYCAITGESAVGKPYSFTTDESIDPRFSATNYIKEHYTYGEGSTNYPEVFASKSDMLGIQQLIDRYLNEKKYFNYYFQ